MDLWLISFQNILESFSFTSEKRKEIQAVIEDRVNTLSDEHVSLGSCLLFGAMIHSSEPQYTNILHDTALNDAAAACKTHGTVCAFIRPSHMMTNFLRRSHYPAYRPLNLPNYLHPYKNSPLGCPASK